MLYWTVRDKRHTPVLLGTVWNNWNWHSHEELIIKVGVQDGVNWSLNENRCKFHSPGKGCWKVERNRHGRICKKVVIAPVKYCQYNTNVGYPCPNFKGFNCLEARPKSSVVLFSRQRQELYLKLSDHFEIETVEINKSSQNKKISTAQKDGRGCVLQ